MAEITGIHHVCVHTPDMKKSVGFYSRYFGFQLLGQESCSFGEYAMMELNGSRLELIQPKEQDENTFGDKGAITHIGIGVRGIDATVEKMRAEGMRFLTEEINDENEPMGGLRAISLIGPGGEHINLYEWKKAPLAE